MDGFGWLTENEQLIVLWGITITIFIVFLTEFFDRF